MRVLRSLSNSLLMVERSLVITMLCVMVLLTFLQVILRNVFSSGILWADTILRHMVLWMAFLGASLAAEQEKHISIDIVTRFLQPKATNLVRILTTLLAGVVSLYLADAGLTFLKSEIESQSVLLTVGTYDLSGWWFQVIIPVGFGLLAFRFLLRTVQHVVKALRPGSDDSEKPQRGGTFV